jgi:acetyl-CoA acetyltransferase
MGVSIVGAGESDLGVTGKSILTLQTQAITRALNDAGLRLSDVDGIATTGVARFSTAALADYLGIQPSWNDSTFAGGSAYEMMIARASQAIEAGQATTIVISFASNQRSAKSRKLGGVVEDWTPEAQFEQPYQPLHPISYYAMAAQAYFEKYNGSREKLAEVAVAAREWALVNPQAFRYEAGPLTVSDVLASPIVSSPLSVADICLVTDGGGAVVLTSDERAHDLAKAPVHVLGYGERTVSTTMTAVHDLTKTGTSGSAADAFARAGLTPAEIDVVEVYDSFSINVILALEGLGFCAPGEALDFIQGGRIRPGGDFPLDTNGGGLSYCHPGQYGVLLLVEAVRQLRGEAGHRQVANARTAVAHGTGGILSTHATVILGTEREGRS